MTVVFILFGDVVGSVVGLGVRVALGPNEGGEYGLQQAASLPGSIVPEVATAFAFGALAWLGWVTRRHQLLSAFLWSLFGVNLAFVAWFVVEAWGCTPGSCENDQAAVILVFGFVSDILLVLVFAIAGLVAGLRRWRAAHGT